MILFIHLTLRLADLTIAYPDRHPDSVNDRETEFRYLKEKIDAGANFIVTQLFYDVDAFLGWVTEIRARGSVSQTIEFVRYLTRMRRRNFHPHHSWDNATTDLRVLSSDNKTLRNLCAALDPCGS